MFIAPKWPKSEMNKGLIHLTFFLSAVDPSCLWLPATIRQRVGTGDIWLQHMDHSSQFRHPFEPFLPHALSRLPLRGVPPGLTE